MKGLDVHPKLVKIVRSLYKKTKFYTDIGGENLHVYIYIYTANGNPSRMPIIPVPLSDSYDSFIQ